MRPSPEQIAEAVKTFGGFRPAARGLVEQGYDISERSIRRSVVRDGYSVDEDVLESMRSDFDSLYRRRVEEFNKKKRNHDLQRVVPVRINIDGPIGLGFMGDPHIDDDGTDIQKLFEHVDIFDGSTEGLYATCLGDLTNNWSGKLARLWAEQGTSADEARTMVEEFITRINWMFMIWGNHDCVSADTELLTKRGWINYTDIKDDDLVLGMNIETDEAEWQNIDAVVVKQKDTIWKLKNGRVDLACSDRHRVLHKYHRAKEWKFRHPADMKADFVIPVARQVVDVPGVKWSDDHIRLTAWILTDGCDEGGNYVIYQSKTENIEYIQDVINSCGYMAAHFVRDREITHIGNVALKAKALPQHSFRILKQYKNAVRELVPKKGTLPTWLYDMTPAQFNIFLTEYIRGDGSWYPEPRTGAIIYGTKNILDELQILCLVNGVSANVACDNRGNYRLNICFKPNSAFSGNSAKWSVEAYEGNVWCLGVRLSNFMVRRNGIPHFTGNCWSGNQELLKLLAGTNVAISKSGKIRIGLKFPNGKICKIFAAHDFPGKSMWSETFGISKRAQLDGANNIYVAGDSHTSSYTHGWHDGSQLMWHALRVASYKVMDRYAEELNLQERSLYQCPVALIDPNAKSELNFIRWEFDPHEAAERLKWMRNRFKRGKSAT